MNTLNIRLLGLIAMILGLQVAYAQGTLKGRVTEASDASTGVAFANVILQGTTVGATTDIDGYYEFTAPAGTYTVVGSFVGYDNFSKPNIIIKDGETTSLNFKMKESSGQLATVDVVEKVERETETAIQMEQKQATEIVQAIGAQELERKGVSDVAAAVTKVTGISKQEGSSGVFVRGLGDRYNSSTFNGLPLPSNNPSRKNISLDLFNTDIVSKIGINKIFSSHIFGDLGGANINIESKQHNGEPFLNVSLSGKANMNSFTPDNFYRMDGPGALGFYNPEVSRDFMTKAAFPSSWDVNKSGLPVGVSFGINGGRSFEIDEEKALNVFFTASYNNEFNYQEGIERGSVNAATPPIIISNYNFQKYNYATNLTGMLNLSLDLNDNSTIYLDNLFINSTNEEVKEYRGLIDFFDITEDGFIRRQNYDQTTLLVTQLRGKHGLNDDIAINWGIANNVLNNVVPDRKMNIFKNIGETVNENGVEVKKDRWIFETLKKNHRYYQTLSENELAFHLDGTYTFWEEAETPDEDPIEKGTLTLGGDFRTKKVDFEATQFDIRLQVSDKDMPSTDLYNIDAVINSENLAKNLFDIPTFRGTADYDSALDPQFYLGRQNIFAGYAKGKWNVNSLLTVSAGGRFERIYQGIEWNTATDGSNDGFVSQTSYKFLPNLSAKYVLNETDNLKFGFSKSYTLPQYKERAYFLFEDVTSVYIGNPDLYESDNYNVDLHYESFMESGAMYSATVFGKMIFNPINELMIPAAANTNSFVNSGEKAVIAGVEAEFKAPVLQEKDEEENVTKEVSINLNASYIFHAEQDLDDEKVAKENRSVISNFTFEKSGLTGLSNLLANADVSYFQELEGEKNIQATLSVGYFSDRIATLGTQFRGNQVDKSFITVNFIAKAQLTEKLKVSFGARNLLNPEIIRIQESPTNSQYDVELMKYQKGRTITLGVSYKL
ncbi:MAG: TonB-dependent receptor [Flavobacteriales bacterium]|jgi:outer membrane receptor for ferrienterochelin and colicin|nr:TonB-dependent receptor [Flavobacteriales bacterium]